MSRPPLANLATALRATRSVACAAALTSGLARADLSEEAFRDPPLQARPSALWTSLNGHTDPQQITHELKEMKAKGMRGAIIWDLGSIADPNKMIPAGPAFLGPESLTTIHHAMDEVERLGLELGFLASTNWNAGGSWITPENGSKALLWSELLVKGPQEFSAVLPLPERISQYYKDVSVLELGTVKEIASVRINGKNAGVLWKQPYRMNLASFLKSDENEIEISVTNLWNHRIAGDVQTDSEDFTRTNLKNKFHAKSPLLSSELIGPVTLHSSIPVTFTLKP
jgi:hypothetical protein